MNHSISSFSFLFVLNLAGGSMFNKPFDMKVGGHPLDWGVGWGGSRTGTEFMTVGSECARDG